MYNKFTEYKLALKNGKKKKKKKKLPRMKSIPWRLKSKLDTVYEIINKLEERTKEIMQNVMQHRWQIYKV